MMTYVIGDVRGNFQALEQLLEQIEFDAAQDTLWFTGNLIGGNGDSLAVLQFVQGLGTRAVSVLGDEELRLLAVAQGVQVPGNVTAFDEILAAPDSDALLKWLRQRPFLHHEHSFTLVHAGIPAEWSLSQAKVLAMEAETSLSMAGQAFLENIFGDDPPPPRWHAKHRGWKRVRFIAHAFTRMRYYSDKGRLYFGSADSEGRETKDLIPWYRMADRAMAHQKIVFGHGSFSDNKPDSGLDSGVVPGIYALGGGSETVDALNAMKMPTQPRKVTSA